jgi:ABC-2 type transport system ATP-binding protein
MTDQPVLSIKDISKQFGLQKAVNHLSLSLYAGQVLGVLGPNGCGKSTLFRMVLGLLHPDTGTVEMMGQSDPDLYRKQIAVALDEHYFDPNLTGLANLKAAAVIKQRKAGDYMPWVEALDLSGALSKRVGNYSFGMKKRLSLITALMKPADLYLLDEPANGLDIPGIVMVRSILAELKAKGKTIILSSHLLGDVERSCTHIALMSQGHLFEYGLTQDVVGGYDSLEDSFMAKLKIQKQTFSPVGHERPPLPPIL